MTPFHGFLFSECPAIQALLESNSVLSNIQIPRNVVDEQIKMDDNQHDNLPAAPSLHSIAVIEAFLQTMECNITLLQEIVTT
jgi:hypothetical protein